MKKLVVILILLVAILWASGCSEKAQENSTNYQNIQNDSMNHQYNSTNHQGNFTNRQNNSTNHQNRQDNSMNYQNSQNKSVVVEATKLKQVNTFLRKGPVFLEIGARGCSDCQTMKAILAQVAADYGDKITVISIDMSKSPKLAEYFGARVVPVSYVIIGILNGNYTYMQEDSNVSSDGSKAKIVGLKHKEVFEKVLDAALLERTNLNEK